MKICLVSNLYNPDILGGAEHVVASLADRMAQDGHEVLVIATKQSAFVPVYEGLYLGGRSKQFYLVMEDLRTAVINSVRNAFMTPIWHLLDIWNPHSYYYVRRLMKDFGPDIVNTHNIFGLSTAVWSAARSLKIPLVHTLYDYSLLCPKTTRYKTKTGACQSTCGGCAVYSVPKRLFSGVVSAVTAPSHQLLDVFEESGMFRTTKKVVIPHGVEGGQPRAKLRQDVVSFLYVGQVSEHKGILTLIKAFMKVESNRAALNIIGLGDSQRKAEKLASADRRIRFYHYVDDESKQELFQNNSVLVLPSLWEEPFGQGILEAYTRGVPVIASAVGALPQLVDHGETGFLVQPGDEADLTQKMDYFVTDAHVLKKLSDNCLKKVEKFRLEEQVKRYCEVYEEVLASRAVSRQ